MDDHRHAACPEQSPGDAESLLLPIHAVERETGIPKELLRMWERRYGFPDPERNALGERLYSQNQIYKLSIIRRLIDNGLRPGKIVGLSIAELEQLCVADPKGNRFFLLSELERELQGEICRADPDSLEHYLQQQLDKMGLHSFIMNFMRLANVMVGDAWMTGKITVEQEHLYSEKIQSMMRKSLGALNPGVLRPRILLATMPDELHTLGLLMVEGLLRLDEVDVLNLGAEIPLQDIVDAALQRRIDVVGLSFSASFAPSRAAPLLEALRLKLPIHIQMWAGGSGVAFCRRDIAEVDIVRELDDIRLRVARWRQQQAAAGRA